MILVIVSVRDKDGYYIPVIVAPSDDIADRKLRGMKRHKKLFSDYYDLDSTFKTYLKLSVK